MEHEILDHRKRLDILQKHLKTNYYNIGQYHQAISDAMKEYAEQVQVNGATTSQDKALHKHIVSGSALPKYDCDDCRYYPCQTEPDSHGSQQRKIEYGKCGDHSERCD